MDVYSIVHKYLKDSGFDCLWCEDCGCDLDDLFSCSGSSDCAACTPGYKNNCKECGNRRDCDMYDEECDDWVMCDARCFEPEGKAEA